MTERELFEFVRTLIPDLQMSEFKFSKYDCYSEKYRLDIELKCRRAHYDDLLIEWIKYDALMQRAHRFNTKPVYINSTPIGIWAFYLDEFSPVWENRSMPKTTDFSNNQKISKRVGYLNVNQGKKLE
jgi:hypothetical protein